MTIIPPSHLSPHLCGGIIRWGIFMSMIEKFQKILDSLVVPQYDEVVGVRVSSIDLRKNFYRVMYFITERLKANESRELMEQTESYFRMLGAEDGDFLISFRRVREGDKSLEKYDEDGFHYD